MRKERFDVHVLEVARNRKAYMTLLLLADEQESMIDHYLERGDMYVLTKDKKALAVVVVTDEGNGVLEIKNLAVDPAVQRQGYGRRMVAFIEQRYRGQYHTLVVGTGDSPLTIPFYESCGFARFHIVRDFFVDHYDHPIVEDGVQLRDMVYLRKKMD